MNNVVLTSASQISPSGGPKLDEIPATIPISEDPATSNVDTNPSAPTETVEETNPDGNVQAHIDFNYQAHDVALAAATHDSEKPNGLKSNENHKLDLEDGYDHPEKVKPCCPMLNKFFLALAIVCFALFICSIAVFISNLGWFSNRNNEGTILRGSHTCETIDPFVSNDQETKLPYFNISHPNDGGIIVVLARRGASIRDILIPYDRNGQRHYRSAVLKGDDRTYFGAVRFGFDDDVNSWNMTSQLPLDYPYLNAHRQDWSMFVDVKNPYRARFVDGFAEIIYEFSPSNRNEFMMRTIISPPENQQVLADPTNNVYFNLRGEGDLSTHYFNLSSATAINLKTSEKLDFNQFVQVRRADQMNEIKNFFQKLDRSGLGKNHVGTLTESTTKTTLNIFSDQAGVIVDPNGVFNSNGTNLNGIRISPRQTPSFQQRSVYGQSLVIYPSELIHTTWWQFNF